MNKLDMDYVTLLQDILDNGVKKQTRNGEVLSVFGRQIRHKMSDGFPLITTKKMHWKSIVSELLWFLQGRTDLKWLLEQGNTIWVGDAYKTYTDKFIGYDDIPSKEWFINEILNNTEFSNKFGELGPVYGKQWRCWDVPKILTIEKGKIENGIGTEWGSWERKPIDQIANLINDLKANPDSRRLMVNSWNVSYLDSMVLPPCHYGFQVYTRELSLEERLCIADKFNPLIREGCLTKTHHPDETEELKLVYRHEFLDSLGPNVVPQRRAISLMWNQRSVDTPLGLPFNIASYGLLLEIIAKMVNMVPDELIGNLGDVHIYSNQIEGCKEQIGRELSLDERIDLASSDIHFDPGDFGIGLTITEEHCHKVCDEYGVPRRTREPYELPIVKLSDRIVNDISEYTLDDIVLENHKSHPTIKFPLSN